MKFEFFVFLLLVCRSTQECHLPEDQRCCYDTLRPGQFYCTSPEINETTQSEVGCSRQGKVMVPCFAAPNVTCNCGSRVVSYNVSQCVFQREQPCRFVESQRYDYRVAVALSLFLGMFGIDRFYLGYPAIGLLKFCTLGFFFIGHLIDFLLILVQAVGPADRTSYYAPFYGPLLTRLNFSTIDPMETVAPASCGT